MKEYIDLSGLTKVEKELIIKVAELMKEKEALKNVVKDITKLI